MNNNLIKIFCFFILFGNSFSTLSQDKIKFGYHDDSGKVINLNNIDNEKESDTIIIVSDTIISSSDSIFVVTFDTISVISSDSIFSELNDTLCVSVLLPLYVNRNDILVKNLKENKKDTNRIDPKSELALDFLEGIMFAVDSLSNLQIPIKLQIYDTENNLDTVKKICDSKFVKQSTIVFGPIFSTNFNYVRDRFYCDTNKIIINPLSHKVKFLKAYLKYNEDSSLFLLDTTNVFFLQPSLKQQKDSIYLFIKKFEKSKNISFVSLESENKKSDYNDIKNRLDSVFTELPFKEFKNLSSINKRSFTFLKDEDNLVFILSEDEAFIKKIITFIRLIDTNISVYASEKIIDIKKIDIETLMKLDIYIPVSNYFDNYSKKNRNLQNKFERVFYHKMNKNSRLSFYSILHFCSNQKQYNFTQLYENGGFINTDVQICTYKDYRLIPIE